MNSRSSAAVGAKSIAFVFIAFAVLSTGCKADKAAAGSPKGGGRDFATPVTVGRAVQRDVPIQAEVIGSVEPFASVSLKPQISGQILEAKFHEGDYVKQGDLLVIIDPRSFEAQLNQAQAQALKDEAALGQAQAALARDRAQQVNAKAQLDRANVLVKQGVISKEQHDQYIATESTFTATLNADQASIESAKAQIAASKAAVDNLKVQLGYAKIYAPITGRTGTMTVKPGNIVMANTTELATINQVQPVYVTFALPETNLAALRQTADQRLPVRAVPEEGGAPQMGAVAFFENTVDPTTGTVKVKARFENSERSLWPGQFVRVTLKLGEHPRAILVPTQAVQSGQDGTFVYVVKSDQKVELRQVATSQRLGDETVVERGVDPGDTVVTEGTLRLIPGSRVSIRERPGAGGGRGMRAAGGLGGEGGPASDGAGPGGPGSQAIPEGGRPGRRFGGPDGPGGPGRPGIAEREPGGSRGIPDGGPDKSGWKGRSKKGS